MSDEQVTHPKHCDEMSGRVAIVGSRGYKRLSAVTDFVGKLEAGTVIVTGGAGGVDKTAERVGLLRKLSVEIFPAQWGKHGKVAGLLRNTQIVDRSTEVVAFWDGVSRGTLDTIRKAHAAGKRLRVFGPSAAPMVVPDSDGDFAAVYSDTEAGEL